MKWMIVLLMLVGPASAQVTYCTGDECTVEENGVKRTLTTDEVGKIKRANSRTAIGNIECRFASDPAQCEAITRDLFTMFPL